MVRVTKREDILEAGQALFGRHGFHAVPIDEVIREAGVSPRTLYAHFPSKEALAVAVLEERHRRFLDSLAGAVDEPDPVTALFDRLEEWLTDAGPSGCLFLRALGEFDSNAITHCVASYRRDLRSVIECFFPSAEEDLIDELLLLVEGATALASTLGAGRAVRSARAAAERMTK